LLHLITLNDTHKHTRHSQEQTSLTPARFEHAIPTSEQPQTHDLDRASTGIG